MKYDVISVDWKPEQTRIWKHWIKKHCPNAIIHTIPDEKPIPWCWSGGKLNCFCYDGFETDKIIYMDTDTIVTKDLEPLFDMEQPIAMSKTQTIGGKPYYTYHRALKKKKNEYQKLLGQLNIKQEVVHYSSGMILLNGYDPAELYHTYHAVFVYKGYVDLFMNYALADEVALSLAMAVDFTEDDIHHIPAHTHGNILPGRVEFGGKGTPTVIHYHKNQRLIKFGFKEWLKI